MEIEIEVDVYGYGKTEHVTIVLNEADIAAIAEIKASEQYACLSVATKQIKVISQVVNI